MMPFYVFVLILYAAVLLLAWRGWGLRTSPYHKWARLGLIGMLMTSFFTAFGGGPLQMGLMLAVSFSSLILFGFMSVQSE